MNQPSEDKQQQKRTIAEWITFSVASLILIAVVGLVSFTWIKKSAQKPPILIINSNKPLRKLDGKYYLPFEVVNHGGETELEVIRF